MEMMLSWFGVTDFEEAKQFYDEVLGLKKTFEMPGWAEFARSEGSASVGLSRNAEAGAGAVVVFRVDDLDETIKSLKGRGVRFEGEIEEIPGVVRLAMFRDPSGNRLQLAQVLVSS